MSILIYFLYEPIVWSTIGVVGEGRDLVDLGAEFYRPFRSGMNLTESDRTNRLLMMKRREDANIPGTGWSNFSGPESRRVAFYFRMSTLSFTFSSGTVSRYKPAERSSGSINSLSVLPM